MVAAAGGEEEKDPRPSLSEDHILTEALALVDEAGLDGLTTRALGRRLGVDPTAIYRYFRNKEELLRALADHIINTPRPPDAQGDGDLRGWIRGACLALRRALLAHPAMTPIMVRRPAQGANTWAATEQALGLLRLAGFSDADAARVYQTMLFYTLGQAALEAPYAALGADRAADELAASRLMYQSLPASRYPNINRVAPYLYGSLDEQFTYGLDRLLDGLGIDGDQPVPQ